jgi:hypothetical protein
MERRAVLQLLCIGMGTVAATTPTKALTLVAPLAPEPSVGKSEDIDRAQVEEAAYGHYRRVARRTTRRTVRRHIY